MAHLASELHASITSRQRPEDVAAIVAAALAGRLKPEEAAALSEATRFAGRTGYYSLMADTWEKSSDATSTVAYVARIFSEDDTPPSELDALCRFRDRLGKRVGWSPAKGARWSVEHIHDAGWSVRRYHRAWHALDVLTEKIYAIERTEQRNFCAVAARAGMAGTITVEEVAADIEAACFVAYFIARRNTRRTFSLEGRDNPFDSIAAMLLARLTDESDWWMVARAYPRPEVLARLAPERQGELIGFWWKAMRTGAGLCAEVNGRSPVNRQTMIVERGQDSDTWNLAAGAYNVARASWLSALTVTGTLAILTATCPPKLPKLMAGDLIFWHTATGGDIAHPDVRVAASLAPAWKVVTGEESCTARDVRLACTAEGLDPETTGWVAPLAKGELGTVTPTPELVHGITVGDPILAAVLRRAGAWSGGPIRWDLLAPVAQSV